MTMNAQQIILWLVIGFIAGFLANKLFVSDTNLLQDLITGIIGAFVGGVVFSTTGWKLKLGNEWLEQGVIALIGAIIVVILARIITA